jgi:cytochrome b561
MYIKNTNEVYGSIAKWFHWLTAIFFLASYCTIYYREWIAESDLENWSAIQLHFSIGISVAVITFLRLIWRCLNQIPEAEPGTRLQYMAVTTGHYALYAIMIIMPVSGYLSIADYLSSGRGSIRYFLLFDINSLKDIQIFNLVGFSLKELEKPADLIHSFLGGWIVWLLIAGHISAALYHHFIKKDKTMYKMTSYKY